MLPPELRTPEPQLSRPHVPGPDAPGPDAPGPQLPRLVYLDNLRSMLVVLVISMHAADTYSPLGNWYFTDRVPLGTPTLLSFAAWQMFLQAFFMGLLFFIAGVFVPQSFDRRGPRRFLRERARRLSLPVLFYMFVLGPITEYYVAHSWTSRDATSFANEWLKHLYNGEFLQENGPLWFCLALLIFSLGYVALRVAVRAAAPRLVRFGPMSAERNPPSTPALVGFALLLATTTFLVRVGRPPTILNMHLGDFPQYVLLFGAGILASRQAWLPRLSFKTGVTWLVLAMTLGMLAWLAIMVGGGALTGKAAAYSGGWHWQSAALDMWESLTCVGVCLGLLVLFRDELGFQGRVGRFAAENAFSVYVFHPPILVGIARMLHGLAWNPLAKFVLLTCSVTVATFAASAVLFRRTPLLRKIL